MNLSEEQKKIGKQNFDDAVGVTRRDFLTGTVAAGLATGAGLGSIYFGYGKSVGDPLRVGVIGTGDEGSVLIGAHNPDYMNIVAIADVRPYNVYRAFHGDMSSANAYAVRPGLLSKYHWNNEDEGRKNVKVYGAYEELLADEDIEAVVIALPLHLHAEAAIKAMRAGRPASRPAPLGARQQPGPCACAGCVARIARCRTLLSSLCEFGSHSVPLKW